MDCNVLKAENAQLKKKLQTLEKEVKRLKKILDAVKSFVEDNAQLAQKKMMAGGLPTGDYHRYEGNMQASNAVATIIGADQTSITKKRNKLFGWGF